MSGRLVPVKAVLERLEAECRERGVRLVYDDLKGEGGFCRLRGCPLLVINRRTSAETRIRILREALSRLAAPVPDTEQPVSEPEPARNDRRF
ncbi:MAG: hypothetical protein ABIK37_03445 [candidate division WOR-3 bacterium]